MCIFTYLLSVLSSGAWAVLIQHDVPQAIHENFAREEQFDAGGVLFFTWAPGVVTSCSGTLIGPRTVLTSGHCFTGIVSEEAPNGFSSPISATFSLAYSINGSANEPGRTEHWDMIGMRLVGDSSSFLSADAEDILDMEDIAVCFLDRPIFRKHYPKISTDESIDILNTILDFLATDLGAPGSLALSAKKKFARLFYAQKKALKGNLISLSWIHALHLSTFQWVLQLA